MSDFKEKCKPAVPKKALLAIAGIMWCCVGIMLTSLAAHWLFLYNGNSWLFVVTGLLIALLVHHFEFLKLVDKNLERISKLPQKPCVFSFISLKSYILIIVMISMGMFLRHSSLPKQYLSIVYIGIGVALFLSSIRYFRNIF
ncbi:MAG: hypothetical protein ACUVQP_04765 [Bacteroidales bacterium]